MPRLLNGPTPCLPPLPLWFNSFCGRFYMHRPGPGFLPRDQRHLFPRSRRLTRPKEYSLLTVMRAINSFQRIWMKSSILFLQLLYVQHVVAGIAQLVHMGPM